jgi:hypothetical protein
MNTSQKMNIHTALLLFAVASFARGSLRPPSVPLLLQSPEINVWSGTDTLQASVPTRWEGSPADWVAMARVDGQSFLLMGSPLPAWQPYPLQTAAQLMLSVASTRTRYMFRAASAVINLTFTSPLLLDDWELLSRPAHYVTIQAACVFSSPCSVQVYFDVTAQVVVRSASTAVQASRVKLDPSSDAEALRIGAAEQVPLSDSKDTPDWGDVYLATARSDPGIRVSTSLNWVRSAALTLQVR